MKDDDFFDSVKDIILFKTSEGTYQTLEEYKAKNPATDKKIRIYYAPGEDTQVSYLNMMKEQGFEVIIQSSFLDTHLYQKLESKLENLEFMRIDSELNEMLINKDKSELVDLDNRTDSQKLKEIFDRAINDKIEASFSKESYAEFIKKNPQAVDTLAPYITQKDEMTVIKPYDIPSAVREQLGEKAWKELNEQVYTDIKIEVKSLKTENIAGMIVLNEYIRRWHDMDMMQHRENSGMLRHHTLIVNQENPSVRKVLELSAAGKNEEVKEICRYIHDLSLLEQRAFTGKELNDFVKRANSILNYL